MSSRLTSSYNVLVSRVEGNTLDVIIVSLQRESVSFSVNLLSTCYYVTSVLYCLVILVSSVLYNMKALGFNQSIKLNTVSEIQFTLVWRT